MFSGFTHPLAGGNGNLILSSVQSPNFIHGSQGWQIDKNGNAEFNSVDFPAGQGVSVFFAGSAPSTTHVGDLWYNTSNGLELSRWSGSAWVPFQFASGAVAAGGILGSNIGSINGSTIGNMGAVLNTNPYFLNGDGTGWSAFNCFLSFVSGGSLPANAPYPNAAEVSTTAATNGTIRGNTAPVPALTSTQYQVGAWVYSSSGLARVQISWALNGTQVNNNVTNVSVPINTWTYVTEVYTSPSSGFNQMWAEIGPAASSSTIFVQAITLQPQVPGSLLQAASVTNSQIAAATILQSNLSAAITARTLGGITTTISATTPGSPATGDIWIDSAAGNQLQQYNGSSFQPISWTATNVISAGTINASLIAAATITGSLIAAGTITAGNIQSATITGALIAANTITASNIAANTITASQIASGTITATQIAAGTITTTQIAAGTILAANIAAGTITTTQLGAGAVQAVNVAANQFGLNMIADPAFTNSTLNAIRIASPTSGTWTLPSNTAVTTQTTTHSWLYLTPANALWLNVGEQYYLSVTITSTGADGGAVGIGIANTAGTQFADLGHTFAGSGTFTLSGVVTIPSSFGATGFIRLYTGADASHTPTITFSNPVCQPAQLFSPTITGGTITGGQFVAYGTSGEILVYSGTPATGNLLASISGSTGTDAHSNAYRDGVAVYGSGGGYAQMGDASGTPVLAFNPASAAHASALPQVYGYATSAGAANEQEIIQLVPGSAGHNYPAIVMRSDSADATITGDIEFYYNNTIELAISNDSVTVNAPMYLTTDTPSTPGSGTAALYTLASPTAHLKYKSDDGADYGMGHILAMASDFTVNSTSFQTLTGLTLNLGAYTYFWRTRIFMNANQSAGQWSIEITAPAGTSNTNYSFKYESAAGVVMLNVNRTAFSTTLSGPATMVSGAYWITLEGTTTLSTAGALVVKGKTSVAADTWEVFPASYFEAYPVT